MAAKYWPRKNPLGQRLKVKDRWMQIVGIAKNANYRTTLEPPGPFSYVPLRQNLAVQNSLLIRTHEKPRALMKPLARDVHAPDPHLPPWPASPLQDQRAQT